MLVRLMIFRRRFRCHRFSVRRHRIRLLVQNYRYLLWIRLLEYEGYTSSFDYNKKLII